MLALRTDHNLYSPEKELLLLVSPTPRPVPSLARDLGATPEEVVRRVRKLTLSGYKVRTDGEDVWVELPGWNSVKFSGQRYWDEVYEVAVEEAGAA